MKFSKKFQFPEHRKHTAAPLRRPADYSCSEGASVFTVRLTPITWTQCGEFVARWNEVCAQLRASLTFYTFIFRGISISNGRIRYNYRTAVLCYFTGYSTCLVTYLHTQLVTYLLTRLFTYSLTHSHSFSYLLTHTHTHSLSYLLTHSLI